MSFRKVTRGDTLKINVEEYIDKPIEGYFLGTDSIDTPLGESLIHKLKSKEGKTISIWGFTYLNSSIENVSENVFCRITYKGKATQKNKYGKFPHQALVEVDEDDVYKQNTSDDVPDEFTDIEPF